MTEEKIIEASKQPQNKERLTDEQLDKVTGGSGENFNPEDIEIEIDVITDGTSGK